MSTFLHYLIYPLSKLMEWLFALVNNYGIAIILFTVATKILLFPVSAWVQKDSIKMVRILPEINRVKIKYYGDKMLTADETSKLYKRVKYSPFVSLIPQTLQILLLLAVIQVIKEIPTDAIGGFLGFELDKIAFNERGDYVLLPVLAALSSLIMVAAQNLSNVLQSEQGNGNKRFMLIFSVSLSLVLGLFTSAGVVFYWIWSNLLAVAFMYFMNVIINPKRYVNYDDLAATRAELAALAALDGGTKARSDAEIVREKTDYKRFFNIVNKHFVIYSEKSGFYKYYSALIERLLSGSNVIIHYVTNDPNDAIFEKSKTEPRIRAYYIGVKKLVTLFMKMDADIVAMTTPDLDKFYLKRSLMRRDVEYIYVPHDTMSSHLGFREGALDAFDTVFAVGPHIEREVRATETAYGLKEKTVVHFGYPFQESLTAAYNAAEHVENGKKTILVAPSWQEDNLLEDHIDIILDNLTEKGYNIIVRPHPEFVKRYKPRMDAVIERHKDKPDVVFELDFFKNSSIYSSDLIMTDWSSIASEFSFSTGKPALFVNTKMKALNPNYERIGVEPVDFRLRSTIGRNLDPADLANIAEVAADLLGSEETYRESVESARAAHFYSLDDNAESGAKYIIDALILKDKNRKKTQ